MKNKIMMLLVIMTLAISAVSAGPKPGKLQDNIKYRQSAMMFMRWNVGVIKKHVVKKPDSFNREEVIKAANAIAAIAGTGLNRLFVPGTSTGNGWKPTRVKPEFFEQPSEVSDLLASLNIEAGELAEVAKGGSVADINTQFKQLFNACRACHKRYRAK